MATPPPEENSVIATQPGTVLAARTPASLADVERVVTAIDRLSSTVGEEVAERMRANAQYLPYARAPNSLRSWSADVRVWRAFCARNNLKVLPATLHSIECFLNERVAAGRKRATVEHYVATLRLVHRLAGLPFPLDEFRGQLLWDSVRRALPERQRQAKALTMKDVETVQATLDLSRAEDLRDSALLAVAFETMFRRSELAGLQAADLSVEANGSGRVFLEISKTDQERKGYIAYLSPATVNKVNAWKSAAGVTTGALFRAASSRSGEGRRFANALQPRDIARIFKRRAHAAKIDEDRVSGHSTRVGATQDLVAANFSTAEIMRQGRWKTARMVVRYSENLEAERSAMARMLRNEKP